MEIKILLYTKDRVPDVIEFENKLRLEEDKWGWDIDESYITNVINSFEDDSFNDSISLLAYDDNKVVGRIDSSMINSHFDGSTKAYLDWICVLKSYRRNGIAQKLLEELKKELKEREVDTLIALTDTDEATQHLYKSLPDSVMKDIGIWIDIK